MSMRHSGISVKATWLGDMDADLISLRPGMGRKGQGDWAWATQTSGDLCPELAAGCCWLWALLTAVLGLGVGVVGAVQSRGRDASLPCPESLGLGLQGVSMWEFSKRPAERAWGSRAVSEKLKQIRIVPYPKQKWKATKKLRWWMLSQILVLTVGTNDRVFPGNSSMPHGTGNTAGSKTNEHLDAWAPASACARTESKDLTQTSPLGEGMTGKRVSSHTYPIIPKTERRKWNWETQHHPQGHSYQAKAAGSAWCHCRSSTSLLSLPHFTARTNPHSALLSFRNHGGEY